jgi:hypothetical protein
VVDTALLTNPSTDVWYTTSLTRGNVFNLPTNGRSETPYDNFVLNFGGDGAAFTVHCMALLVASRLISVSSLAVRVIVVISFCKFSSALIASLFQRLDTCSTEGLADKK